MSEAPAGDLDLLDGDFYAGDPHPTYAWMRAHAPVYRDDANGLWGVSRYDDIVYVEKNPELFSSEPTIVIAIESTISAPKSTRPCRACHWTSASSLATRSGTRAKGPR